MASKAPSIFKSRKYRTLGQEEGGDGVEVEDHRQNINKRFGQAMIRFATVLCIVLLVKLVVETWSVDVNDMVVPSDKKAMELFNFRQNAPLVLFVGIFQILACGACAHTAAAMYTRRRHSLQHPKDAPEAIQRTYVKVHLEKETGREDEQLYGLNYRTSTDGLECLIVEAVRPGSLLARWNRESRRPSPQELVERALGDGLDEGDIPPAEPASSSSASASAGRSVPPQVYWGSAIVAVNGVHGDVGLMQQQLALPKVTLWVKCDFGDHASDFQGLIMDDADGSNSPSGAFSVPQQPDIEAPASSSAAGGKQDAAEGGDSDAECHTPRKGYSGQPAPQQFGQANTSYIEELRRAADATLEMSAPKVACLAMEDEEPQILVRWTACSLLFGWVTMLPVLLMHPHEERPRQQLFRQFLLKPSLFVLPLWVLLWMLDSIEIAFAHEIMPPFGYFSFCHMIFPTVLLWFLFKMQAEDERICLEQRKAREAEASAGMPFCCEDPPPTFVKELLVMNPVSIVLVGANLAIQICCCTLLQQLTTRRGQLAMKQAQIVYGPLVFVQLGYLYVLSKQSFLDLPEMYATGFAMLISAPCLMLWCACLFCAARYGKMDMALVQLQREERAEEALKKTQVGVVGSSASAAAGQAGDGDGPGQPAVSTVDCSEVANREWELVFSA